MQYVALVSVIQSLYQSQTSLNTDLDQFCNEAALFCCFIRLPLYGEAKAMLLAWLVLPHFKGATWVYETIIGPGSSKLRTELHKIPALERMLNREEAATSQVT